MPHIKRIPTRKIGAYKIKTELDLSIHPRNWPAVVFSQLGWKERVLKNTSGSASKKVKDAKLERMMQHQQRHPADRASVDHLNKIM